MTRRGGKTHKVIVEACATIALAVSQTQSGAAHTVQLMLRNPDFRQQAMEDALGRVATDGVTSPCEHQLAAEQDVKHAVRQLLQYSGIAL